MKASMSPLRAERERRGWSRPYVEAHTEGRISQCSLERWEEGKAFPRTDNLNELCKLYGKSPKELGLDKSHDIMGATTTRVPTSEEELPMSDLIRRSALSDLGSSLIGLISTWPRRNYRYRELQAEINKAVIDHSTLAPQDASSVIHRRQALMVLGLVPIQLIGGVATRQNVKTADTDTLLTHCAAGITACWYLRRGKDLAFVSDLTSSYIAILKPLIYSHSEAYRKASATLLAQSFMLKSKLAHALQDNDQAIAYEEKAIQYALIAENVTEQALASREMALLYWHRGTRGYEQALSYAETAYGLMQPDIPKIIRSFTASGLSLCQAACGHAQDARVSLKEAYDLFDPATPIASMPYSESMLSATVASVHRHSQSFQEAIDLYEKILTLPDISALGAVGERIKYAEAEVSRDDIQTRNMDLCITLLTEAIIGAKELDSKLYMRKAGECFSLMRVAWPREDAIKTLSKDHFGIKK